MAEYKTEAQKVYESIREAVLSGTLKPGDKLPQRRLADQFKATTITVREALRALESEGLVVIEPKWGAMVEEITPKRIFGRYVVREALEGMAARLAAQHVNAQSGNRLIEMAEECDHSLGREDVSPHEKAHIHHRLHQEIAEQTDCGDLINLLNKLNLHTIIMSNAYHIDWTTEEEHWHRRLIDAILSGNPNQAEQAMRVHVQRGYEMELRAITKSETAAAVTATASAAAATPA